MSVYVRCEKPWFSQSLWYLGKQSETSNEPSHSRLLLFAQLFLVDNLIKLFIVDIYHVIKHATLCVYNNTHTHTKRIALDTALSCHFYFFIACFFLIHFG